MKITKNRTFFKEKVKFDGHFIKQDFFHAKTLCCF